MGGARARERGRLREPKAMGFFLFGALLTLTLICYVKGSICQNFQFEWRFLLLTFLCKKLIIRDYSSGEFSREIVFSLTLNSH